MPKCVGLSLPKDVKRIGFFGLGRSNLALLGAIGDIPAIIRSEKPVRRSEIPSGVNVAAIFDGEHAFDTPCEDVLVLSPSARRERPEIAKFATRGTLLTSDAELFFGAVDSPVFAVSGSDGKSTTATLASLLLGESFGKTALCGNIGKPFCEALSEGYDAYAVELSSFTLRYLAPKSERAALTNITPNHLNWHDSFEEYRDAKMAIFRNTGGGVINFRDKNMLEYARLCGCAAAVGFGRSARDIRAVLPYADAFTDEGGNISKNGVALFPVSAIKRKEAHNIENLLTALALTDGYWSSEGAGRVAENFGGLSHRCESVGEACGIEFINSSIDTTPSRTLATLASLKKRAVVILGGRDKGVSFTELGEKIGSFARGAVLVGECRETVAAAMPDGFPYEFAEDMESAVGTAAKLCECGDAVLLSPAATSFDMYENYEKRGEDFKKIVFDYCEKYRKM